MRLVVATKNKGKLKEFKEILSDTPWEVIGMEDAGVYIDIEENADTFEGNALLKADQVMKQCGEITVADDSGICVNALGGAPGVYSARYAGDNATDLENNLKLLKAMENETSRSAKFVCAIAVARPSGETKILKGEFFGEIAYDMKGSGGFGYDCLFYLPEYKKTSAEIPAELKNQISHRAKALRKLKEYLLAAAERKG